MISMRRVLKRDAMAGLLLIVLAEGREVSSSELREAAAALGVSHATLLRALREVGAAWRKEPVMQSEVFWRIPLEEDSE